MLVDRSSHLILTPLQIIPVSPNPGSNYTLTPDDAGCRLRVIATPVAETPNGRQRAQAVVSTTGIIPGLFPPGGAHGSNSGRSSPTLPALANLTLSPDNSPPRRPVPSSSLNSSMRTDGGSSLPPTSPDMAVRSEPPYGPSPGRSPMAPNHGMKPAGMAMLFRQDSNPTRTMSTGDLTALEQQGAAAIADGSRPPLRALGQVAQGSLPGPGLAPPRVRRTSNSGLVRMEVDSRLNSKSKLENRTAFQHWKTQHSAPQGIPDNL